MIIFNTRLSAARTLLQALVFIVMLAPSQTAVQAQIETPRGPSLADDKPVGDPLAADQTPASLSAKLTFDELTGTASVKPEAHLLKITVVNSGKRALLLDADNVFFADSSATKQSALERDDVIKAPTNNTLPGDAVETAFSISTGGIGPVVVDAANKAKNPGPAFYGKDEERRDLAELRFGKRLVFPGESSSGSIFLSKSVSQPTQISIPVFSHPEGTELGNLNLTVTIASPTSQADASKAELRELPPELAKPLAKKQSIERRR